MPSARTAVCAVGGTSHGLPTQGRLEKSRRALAENGGRVGARGSLAGRARAEANESGKRYSWRLPFDTLGECQIKISPRENHPGVQGAAFRVSLVLREPDARASKTRRLVRTPMFSQV